MKKILSACLFVLLVLCPPIFAASEMDIEKHSSCEYCGMNRSMFAHSRMLIEYTDGRSAATCSLHCAAVELALQIDKTPLAILVGDFNTKQLIDAEKSSWVIGGKKPGVMTANAKWAFAERAAAEQFVKEQGGVISDFETAIKSAYEDMYRDTQMIRKKRQAKKMTMGN